MVVSHYTMLLNLFLYYGLPFSSPVGADGTCDSGDLFSPNWCRWELWLRSLILLSQWGKSKPPKVRAAVLHVLGVRRVSPHPWALSPCGCRVNAPMMVDTVLDGLGLGPGLWDYRGWDREICPSQGPPKSGQAGTGKDPALTSPSWGVAKVQNEADEALDGLGLSLGLWGFSKQDGVLCPCQGPTIAYVGILFCSFSYLYPFGHPHLSYAVAKMSSTMLNSYGENENLCPITDFRANALRVSPME